MLGAGLVGEGWKGGCSGGMSEPSYPWLFVRHGRSSLSSLPSRVGTTLKRKFWDSNEVASSSAGEGNRKKGRASSLFQKSKSPLSPFFDSDVVWSGGVISCLLQYKPEICCRPST